MVNPSAAFQKASEAQGQPATIGLLAQSMFQVGLVKQLKESEFIVHVYNLGALSIHAELPNVEIQRQTQMSIKI